jgi:hypothetical protein
VRFRTAFAALLTGRRGLGATFFVACDRRECARRGPRRGKILIETIFTPVSSSMKALHAAGEEGLAMRRHATTRRNVSPGKFPHT